MSMEFTIDELYNAMAYAETGTHPKAKDNPWVRTYAQGSGSSAYGPVQMTGGKHSMMMNVYNKPELLSQIGITEEERGYMSDFLQQADEFLAPVSDEYESTFGYGGPGVLTKDTDKAMYESVAKKIMTYEYGRANKDLDTFIKNWRDAEEKDDSQYYKKVRDSLGVSTSSDDKVFNAVAESIDTPALDLIKDINDGNVEPI